MKKRNKIEMFHFTQLEPRHTGIPVSVLVEEKCSGNKEPRIIVLKKPGETNTLASVDILYENDPPEIIGQGLSTEYYERVMAWIRLNKVVLLSHWKNDLDSYDLLKMTKKL